MPKRKRKSDGNTCKDLKPRSKNRKTYIGNGNVSSEDDDDDGSIWVQCEKKNCLKWRKITSEELEKVGDGSWYCSMNWDPHFNRCSAPERIDKLPKHMKYIYSLLPKADIVMARIPGYPLWPGILTPDPTCGEYYDALLEKQDQPIQYHVEFLGKPHSRAWVRPKMVHPYNAITEDEKLMPLQKGSSKLLGSYRTALDEAKRLLSVSASDRLKLSCQFKYIENDRDSDKSDSKKKTVQPHSPVVQPKEKVDYPSDSYSDFDDYLSSPDEKQPNESSKPSAELPNLMRFEKKKKNLPKRIENQLEPAEKEFLNSLKETLAQKGLPPPRQPKWKGQHISLLMFFTRVQQHGGFESVCKSKSWNQVYNNLVKPDDTTGSGGMGNKARLFYQRHLLPYEAHMNSLQTSESHLVPSPGAMSPDICDKQKPLLSSVRRERNTSTSTLASDGEQKVPVHVMAENIESPPSSSAMGDHPHESPDHYTPTLDCVPSSNPNSPLNNCYGGITSESEDEDEDLGIDCRSAEYELQQLERLLSSLEPSLYPPQAQESSDKRRPQETTPLNSSSLSGDSLLSSGVDVLKTLDEMSRIEGTIADLDTMVSVELENL